MMRIQTPYEGTGHREWDPSAPIPAPLRLHRTAVLPEWVDYNGHLSESCYLLVFGDNADAFFRFIGIDEQYRAEGYSLYTVETHIHNRREAAEADRIELSMQLLDHDAKRIHLFHEMRLEEEGTLLATAEQMLVHVDTRVGGSVALSEQLVDRVAAITRAHAALPWPEVAGRPMAIRKG